MTAIAEMRARTLAELLDASPRPMNLNELRAAARLAGYTPHAVESGLDHLLEHNELAERDGGLVTRQSVQLKLSSAERAKGPGQTPGPSPSNAPPRSPQRSQTEEGV